MAEPINPLTKILLLNPHILAAYYDDPVNPSRIIVHVDEDAPPQKLNLPNGADKLTIAITTTEIIRPLITTMLDGEINATHQGCQDEPIQLGTQLQPEHGDWVGTAGAPVAWIDERQQPHWGILSNWHVMAGRGARFGATQHQPTKTRPACAVLSATAEPLPNEPNQVDAAVADANIDGYHTISNRILEIGELTTSPITATPGMRVIKSGRTTGLTRARCSSVGASTRVSYGDFVALFEDQDIFEPDEEPFSAPGDSGSLIIAEACRCPVSLLFAGSRTLTVGNPMRHVTRALNLRFPFPDLF
jgi:hypothetical protein